jgi:hypothetical protein
MLGTAAALTRITGGDYLLAGLRHASQPQRAPDPVRE